MARIPRRRALSVCIWIALGLTAIPGLAQDRSSESGAPESSQSEETSGSSDAPEDADQVERSEESGEGWGEEVTEESSSDSDPSDEDSKGGPEAVDPTWVHFREAVEALAAGKRDKAAEMLRSIRRNSPEHPAAQFAKPVLEELAAARSQKKDGETDTPDAQERPAADRLGLEPRTKAARAALAGFQTIHGLGFGAELCGLFFCSVRAGAAIGLLTGGAALGTVLLTTEKRVAPGRTLAINAGTVWGAWNAGALTSIATSDSRVVSTPTVLGVVMLGQLAGTAAGEGAWRLFRPYSGDVALFNSAGLWGGGIAGLALASADPGGDLGSRGTFAVLLTASDLGAVGGALIANANPMDRGRVHVINLGGVIGGLVGIGATVLVGGRSATSNAATASAAFGAPAGLALTTFLTRNWTIEDSESEAGREATSSSIWAAPARIGGGAGLSVGGRF